MHACVILILKSYNNVNKIKCTYNLENTKIYYFVKIIQAIGILENSGTNIESG